MITYAQVRLNSNQSVQRLDAVSGQAGFDIAFYTSEIDAYYNITRYLTDNTLQPAQPSVLLNSLNLQFNQTLWLHRNHRLVLELGANVEAATRSTTFMVGAFWEGSYSRGLDDYSTPETNLPQQLGRGRGFLKPEETLR
jgi:hypothetical protein